jgi:hypothetical protein
MMKKQLDEFERQEKIKLAWLWPWLAVVVLGYISVISVFTWWIIRVVLAVLRANGVKGL